MMRLLRGTIGSWSSSNHQIIWRWLDPSPLGRSYQGRNLNKRWPTHSVEGTSLENLSKGPKGAGCCWESDHAGLSQHGTNFLASSSNPYILIFLVHFKYHAFYCPLNNSITSSLLTEFTHCWHCLLNSPSYNLCKWPFECFVGFANDTFYEAFYLALKAHSSRLVFHSSDIWFPSSRSGFIPEFNLFYRSATKEEKTASAVISKGLRGSLRRQRGSDNILCNSSSILQPYFFFLAISRFE